MEANLWKRLRLVVLSGAFALLMGIVDQSEPWSTVLVIVGAFNLGAAAGFWRRGAE